MSVFNLIMAKKHFLIIVFLILISYYRLAPHLMDEPFFVDEYHFIRKSYFYDLFFVRHDLRDPRWSNPALDGDISQPKIGPYIFGFALHLSGISDIDKKLSETNFITTNISNSTWFDYLSGHSPSYYEKLLHEPLKLIHIGRLVSVFFGILTVIAVFLLVCSVVGLPSAILASLILLTNPLFNSESRLASTSVIQLFFMILSLYLAYLWQQSHQKGKLLFNTIISTVLGLTLSFTIGVKTTGVIVLVPVFFVIIYSIFKQIARRKMVHLYVVNLFLIIFLTLSSFIYLHPITYRDIPSGLVQIFISRTERYTQYWDRYPDYAVSSRLHALQLTLHRSMLPWGEFTNFPLRGYPVDMYLILQGIFVCLYSMFLSRKKLPVNSPIIIIWFSTTFVGLILYLVNDWSRYYLPLVSAISILEALGLINSYSVMSYYFRAIKSYHFLQ